MERVGQTLNRTGHHGSGNATDLTKQILADPRVASFIQEHSLSQDEIKRSLPKFNQFLVECRKVKEGDASYIAKGYEPILTMNEGYADVTYKETRQLKEQQEQQAIAKRINLVSLPQSYRKITFADIALDDVARVDTFESLVDFVANYPSPDQKGLYIYGDMGVGKSFMLAAMAHELSETKKVVTTIIHYPSFTIDVKNGIKDGSVKEQIDAVKQAEVLVLDDIGAEQFSSWIRDDVLQVILQHRMIEELPTFFTSNYSFADLEAKLSNGRQGDETWQAKRVMERIRFLAKEVHLKGVNRR
ncbi:primosomal protein DnaI [Streptococcus salivarius]|jgi:DNA replication protein|uniref:primosomal protein DnaI n=1 Tax=Streptococcus salivarius TaxID=1304 RepID=UPI0002251034|nr:primosomal protein DnaI [Streptococcus salivarius]EGX31162.1 primosomal protein DnaI [Streptococcus salivarius M18]MBZ5845421.1 primosomal protein DnaI [Streptococcus salivarius]